MKKIVLSLLFSMISLFAFEELNIDNFESKIKDKNVIVDFYAVWCPPCKILNKKLKEFELIRPNNVEIYKLDIDKEPLIAKKYGITRLPSLVYFKNGKAIKTIVGIQSSKELYSSSKKIFNLD